MGMFGSSYGGAPAAMATNVAALQQPIPQIKAKKGFNDPGGWAEKLGNIGALLMASGGNPAGGQLLAMGQQRAQQRAQEQRAELQRQQDWEDFQREYAFKLKNPMPTGPHRWESNDGSLMEIGPDGAPRVVYKDPSPKINWVEADDGRGGRRLVPFVNGMPMGQSAGGPAPSATLPPGFTVDGDGGAGSGAPRPFP
jgi:hypothetical protein